VTEPDPDLDERLRQTRESLERQGDQLRVLARHSREVSAKAQQVLVGSRDLRTRSRPTFP
jgi:hypothetical protein